MPTLKNGHEQEQKDKQGKRRNERWNDRGRKCEKGWKVHFLTHQPVLMGATLQNEKQTSQNHSKVSEQISSSLGIRKSFGGILCSSCSCMKIQLIATFVVCGGRKECILGVNLTKRNFPELEL